MTEADHGAPISSPDLADGDDLRRWGACFQTVFGVPGWTPEQLAARQERWRAQRLTGVRDGDRWAATFRTWDDGVTVPDTGPGEGGRRAGRTVPGHLVSTVSVAPTHRRRGVLSTLMRESLQHAADRGVAVASLVASEAPIYGRYGFGAAVDEVAWRVDTQAARAWLPGVPQAGGHVRLADDDDLAEHGPAVYEAARRLVPGAVGRSAGMWEGFLEREPGNRDTPGPRLRAVHVADDGSVDGYVRLRVEQKWEHRRPRYEASVDDLAAVEPSVLAALWRFCLDLDLVRTLTAGSRPVGELLPELVLDRRATMVEQVGELFWLRVLDPAAALGGRGWSAPGRVVLDVVDDLGHAAGRWSVDVDAEGDADVRRTDAAADISLPVQTLASVLTGSRDLRVLAAAGRLTEEAPGALARLSRMCREDSLAHVTFQGF